MRNGRGDGSVWEVCPAGLTRRTKGRLLPPRRTENREQRTERATSARRRERWEKVEGFEKNTKDHEGPQRRLRWSGPCVRKGARPARGPVGAWRASHAMLWFWGVPWRSRRPICPIRPIGPTALSFGTSQTCRGCRENEWAWPCHPCRSVGQRPTNRANPQPLHSANQPV